MDYETPRIEGPSQMYETPLLLDVAELSASWCVCVTGGSNGVEQQAP